MLNSGPDAAKVADKLAQGEFVILLESKEQSDKAHWEVYGLRQGLSMSSATREAWSDDTRTGWAFELQETGSNSAGDWVEDSVVSALG
jgi:predicted alpha/beta hydrolase family esterase